MMMFHGSTLYAVHSRTVGTFGGKAARATIKVYDTRDCGSPVLTVSGELTSIALGKLREHRGDREAVQAYLTSILAGSANV
jgi:hypothetical protein